MTAIFDVRPSDGVVRAPDGESWVAASHAAVSAVLREPVWTSDHRLAAVASGGGVPELAAEVLSKILLFMDGEDHVRVRGLVGRAFHARSIEQLRPRMSALTEELLAPLRGRGAFDVIDELALPLPVTIICELLGVPSDDRALLRQLTAEMAAILDPDAGHEELGSAVGSALGFMAYLVPLFEARRRAPRDDLLTALVQAEEAGDRLDAAELVSIVVLLLVAGHETTMNLIGNGLLALLRNPSQLALLRSDPSLIGGAVEELLRYDPPVRVTVRTARRDTTLGGQEVRAGEQVIARLDAANRDGAVFELPDVLDIRREGASRHVAFGAGPHYCLGAALARAEAQVALSALVALPRLALAVDEPVWRPMEALHALQSLPVTC